MKLIKYLTSEPVRAYLYTVIVPLLGLFVALGIVTTGMVPMILSVVGAVLAISGVGAVEAARSAVKPVATLTDPVVVQAEPAVDGSPGE